MKNQSIVVEGDNSIFIYNGICCGKHNLPFTASYNILFVYQEIIIEIFVIDLNFQVGNFPIQSIIFALLSANRGFHLTDFLESAKQVCAPNE